MIPRTAEWVRMVSRQPLPLISKIFIAVSVALLWMIGAAVPMVYASYQGGEARAVARTPQISTDTDDAIALWRQQWTSVDEHYMVVHYYIPLTPDAPTPPGIDHWPAPGETVLSPALLSQDPASQDAQTRFAPVTGVISTDALVSPSERLAYTVPGPSATHTAEFYPISGYNGAEAPFGDVMYRRPISWFYAALLPATLVGTLVLLVASVRNGDAGFQQTRLALALIGVRRRDLAALATARLSRPYLAGSALGIALTAPFLLTDIRIPGVGFTVQAVDVRTVLPGLILGLVTGGVLALLASVFATLPESIQLRRLRWLSSRLPAGSTAALVCVLSTISILPIYHLLKARSQGAAFTVFFILAVIVIVMTLPALVSAASRWGGAATAHFGRFLGAPGLILSGRQITENPKPGARIAAGMIVCLVLLTQVQLWTAIFSRGDIETNSLDDRVLVSKSFRTAAQWQPLIQSLRDQGIPWLLFGEPDENPSETAVLGDRAALEAAHIASGDQATASAEILAQLRPVLAAQDAVVRAHSELPAGAELQIVAFSPTHAPLDIVSIQSALHRDLAPAPDLRPPGAGWLVSALASVAQVRWLTLFGTVGVTLLLLGVLVAAGGASLRSRIEIGPLAAIGAHRRVVYVASYGRIAVPVLTGMLLGLPITTVTSIPMIDPLFDITIPWSFIIAILVVVGAVSCGIGALTARVLVAEVESWRPGDPMSHHIV